MVRTRLAVAALAVALTLVPGAAADGDPASDVLLAQNTFVPYPAPSADTQSALSREVAAVYAMGYWVKVAVVASATDLGAIPSLFNHPADYAKFLGTELQSLYVGPLLIVMPSGFGVYDGGRPTTAEDAVLANLKVVGTSVDDLTRTAASALDALLRAGALRSKDILPPYTEVLQATGRRGSVMKLQYRVYDDSGKASALLQVIAPPGRTVATFRIPLRSFSFQTPASVEWKVPRSVKPGLLKLCLTATGPSGNRSKRICYGILIT